MSRPRGAFFPRALHDELPARRRGSRGRTRASAMMRRYNRLLVLFFVVSDSLISGSSFALAYMLRFHWLTGLLPVTRVSPPFEYYGKLLPFVMAILPLAFHV